MVSYPGEPFDAIDRISWIPEELIYHILQYLDTDVAARTSVLSKTWLKIWLKNTHLRFGPEFFGKRSGKQIFEICSIISNILLLHTGPVLVFKLFIPQNMPVHQADIWIKYVSRNGVKELDLSGSVVGIQLPFGVFSCERLTDLCLSYGILNPPSGFNGFCSLINVSLSDVTITGEMSFGTDLEILELVWCTGINHLGGQFRPNNKLVRLEILSTEAEINWQWFGFTTKLEELELILEAPAYTNETIVDSDALLKNLCRIKELRLNGVVLKLLEPAISDRLGRITMENLNLLSLYNIGCYDAAQIGSTIGLIRRSPNLKVLEISLDEDANLAGNAVLSEAVKQYLESPELSKMILQQVEDITINGLSDIEVEYYLIKLLIASSPSLRLLEIAWTENLSDSLRDITLSKLKKLLKKASAKAEILILDDYNDPYNIL